MKRRATPISTPMSVAKKMPTSVTLAVLTIPTQMARA